MADRPAADGPPERRGGGFLAAGSRIHGYVIERVAAVGGEAVVYEARDPLLGRTVAIKVLRHRPEPGRFGWRGLAGEGRRTVRLRHPAFVTVYGIFPHGEGMALVMEWVEGLTLAERLARGPLAAGEARRIFRQLAEALAAAHAAGLVHGDLTPANVMIDRDGGVRLLDPIPPAPPGSGDGGRATPPYAAPELLRGEPPTPAADVHAFGAMLNEALGAGDAGSGAGGPLRRLARRCLASDPLSRPADGTALVARLGAGRRVLSRRTRAAVAAGLLGAVTAGFLAGSWMARRAPAGHRSWRGVERLPVGGSLPAVLADGSAVVYRSADGRGIEILPLRSGVSQSIWHGTAPITDLDVFPDGRRVVFTSPDAEGVSWLWALALDGGFPRRIAPGVAPAVSPDGGTIAAVQPLGDGSRRIVILGGDGAVRRTLRTYERSPVPVAVAFGPKGRSVLVTLTDGIRRSRLERIPLGDGPVETLVDAAGVAGSGATLHRGLDTLVWPVRTAVRGDAALMATPLRSPALGTVYQGPGRASHPSLDREGRLLAFQLTEIDTELATLAVSVEGGPPVSAMEVLPGSRGASQPRIGPDPAFLLFRAATGAIQLMDRSTGRIRGLLTAGEAQYNPGWSPGGRRVVCACLADGRSDLWAVPAEGGPPERLTDGAGNDFQPVWHPDGRHVLFVSDRDGVEDLYVLDLDDGGVRRLGRDGAINPAIASDGRSVAFVVGAYGESPRLRLSRLDEALTVLTTVWERPVVIDRWAGAKARFSPDAHWLAFDQPREGGGADIWAVPVENGGTARAVRLTALPFPAALTGWFDWGPDWKIVATVARRHDRICILRDAASWLQRAR